MDVKFCKTCGASLIQKDAYTWECNYCRNTYSDKSVREESEKLLRVLLSEDKLEKVANLRRNLYDALGEQYTDSQKICSICEKIKEYIPDDAMACFYCTANSGTPSEICESIRSVDAEKDFSLVYGMVKHILRSMRSEYALPLQDLVERAYKGTDTSVFEDLSTLISDEMEKVNAGTYETSFPRDVFIAYSSKDMRKVEELVEYLEKNGLDCFVAARNLRHGRGAKQNYEIAIHEALDNCRCLVLVSSGNSRSMECDALRVELKYVKAADTLCAPAEYRKNYASIPYKYKKYRVEYRIDNLISQPYAEKVVTEFFGGLEYAYSPEEVVHRIYSFDDADSQPEEVKAEEPEKIILCPYCGSENPISADVCRSCKKELRKKSKFCASCGSENPIASKFCNECGENKFVSTYKEYELTKELTAMKKAKDSEGVSGKDSSSSSDKATELNAIGCDYYNGKNGKAKDLIKAYEYFFKAAELGSADGACNLGICCEYGQGIVKDPAAAFKWYSIAAERKSTAGAYYLACCYERALGTDEDLDEAFKWYKISADRGSAAGANDLARFYEIGLCDDEDPILAFEWYKISAERKSADGAYNLARCYQDGIGVDEDLKSAFDWYKVSAERESANGAYELARCYEEGNGVEVNTALAQKWYETAKERGSKEAADRLDKLQKEEDARRSELSDIARNNKRIREEEARKAEEARNAVIADIARKAKLRREQEAKLAEEKKRAEEAKKAEEKERRLADARRLNDLGVSYFNGSDGKQKNYQLAFEYFTKAAPDLPIAKYNLSECYLSGRGVRKDKKKAFEYCRLSAEEGCAAAQCRLGCFYEEGKLVKKDKQAAFKWYSASYENGDAEGAYYLGRCYEYKIGTEKNESKAKELYAFAQSKGYPGAARAVKRLSQSKGVRIARATLSIAAHVILNVLVYKLITSPELMPEENYQPINLFYAFSLCYLTYFAAYLFNRIGETRVCGYITHVINVIALNDHSEIIFPIYKSDTTLIVMLTLFFLFLSLILIYFGNYYSLGGNKLKK